MSDDVLANKLNYPATEQQISLPEAIDSRPESSDRLGRFFFLPSHVCSSVQKCKSQNSRSEAVQHQTEEERHFREFFTFQISAHVCFTHVPNAATQYTHKYAKLLSKNEFSRRSSLATSVRLEQLKLLTLGWDLYL